jgi:C1A family cysteine protease
MKGPAIDAFDVRVDLRGFWSGVRDQGGRSSCLACAASDAHAHSHKRDQPLSAEFLFFHAGQLMPGKTVAAGLTFSAVHKVLHKEGQPDEKAWPYASSQPDPWTPPTMGPERWYGSLESTAADVATIIKTLGASRPVILGVRLTPDFLALRAAPYVIPPGGTGFGGHAILAIGLADHLKHGSLILTRNSWGSKWGDGGCGWLSVDYLTDKLIGYRVVNPLPGPK